jgi:hypothetical protein
MCSCGCSLCCCSLPIACPWPWSEAYHGPTTRWPPLAAMPARPVALVWVAWGWAGIWVTHLMITQPCWLRCRLRRRFCCAHDNHWQQLQVMKLQLNSLSFHMPNHCRHQPLFSVLAPWWIRPKLVL